MIKASGRPWLPDREAALAQLSQWVADLDPTALPEPEPLAAALSHSRYLRNFARKHPARARALAAGADPEADFAALCREVHRLPLDLSRADMMRRLRNAKAEAAFLIALQDIAGRWPLEAVTARLSAFAAACLDRACGFALAAQGIIDASSAIDAEHGYFILAMGKFGAGELNYSSDIDLIAFYDEDSPRAVAAPSADRCIKATRDLVDMLERRTADGYVFRVDLQLRPDPSATPVAIPVAAAESYYQSTAQNWERAAMIKARVVAGDRHAGESFLGRLDGFVWRRSIDFAAIEDIHRMLDMIHRHHHHKGVDFAGFDVKLGHGGIREIEFFTQTQQLLAGGRDPALRAPATLDALAALEGGLRLAPEAARRFADAYRYLRTLEHRLQMVNDEQTHQVPRRAEDQVLIASFMGYQDRDAFREELVAVTRDVSVLFQRLLPPPDHAASMIDLTALSPSSAQLVDKWRSGRLRALHNSRARKLFDQCLPDLLAAFQKSATPQAAMARFDGFLSQLPAGVQLFSLFRANPAIMRLIVRLMGTTPALGSHLAKNPWLIDGLTDPDFFELLPSAHALRNSLEQSLTPIDDEEALLIEVRRWHGDMKFRIGVQMLEGLIDPLDAGRRLSDLADCAVQALARLTQARHHARYGAMDGNGLAILAFGRFGGRELTFSSDLDLVFVFDPPDTVRLDGPAPGSYFSRLSQSIITALTAATAQGRLFDVDTRLRPFGSAGAIAVALPTFTRYYRDNAWTWEHMALSRCRVIYGDGSFGRRVARAVFRTLSRHRDAAKLLPAIDAMREKLAGQQQPASRWAVKHSRGGLVDIEFIVQALILRHGEAYPALVCPDLAEVLKAIEAAGLLDDGQASALMEGWRFQYRLLALLRLQSAEDIADTMMAEDAKAVLANAVGLADIDAVDTSLRRHQAAIRDIYRQFFATG